MRYRILAAILLGIAFSATPIGAQGGDDCSTAIPIFPGLTFSGNVGATDGLGVLFCPSLKKDVWYSYVPAVTGTATVAVCASSFGYSPFSPSIGAFRGSCGSLISLDCKGSGCPSFDPKATFPIVAGQTYYIAVGESSGGQGAFNVKLESFPLPSNDECTAAIPITDGLTTGSNFGATTGAVTGSCGPMESEVWYAYQATCSALLTASLCPGTSGAGADYDTTLAIFTGSCGSLTEVACNDDACGFFGHSEVTIPVVAGQTYSIAVGGAGGEEGEFSLFLACETPPPNGNCSSALPITDGLTTGSNLGASAGSQSGMCASFGPSVWYRYVAPIDGIARASFCAEGASAPFDSVLAAFQGPCGSQTQLACNDDACGDQAQIDFEVEANKAYFIAVRGAGPNKEGPFTLSLETRPFLWKPKAIPPIPVSDAAAGLLDDEIFLSHGSVAGVEQAQLSIYDVPTDTWSPGPSAGTARTKLAGAVTGGLYYAIGGAVNGVPTGLVEIFDPATSTWSTGPPLPTPRGDLVTVVLDGRIHAIGGMVTGGFGGGLTSPVDDHEVFDPATGAWSSRAPLPTGLGRSAAAVLSGRIHVFGGWIGSPFTFAHPGHQIYDPVTDTWSSGALLPNERRGGVAGVLEYGELAGKAFLMGGNHDGGPLLNAVDVYDPATDSWSTSQVKPTPVEGLAVQAPSSCRGIYTIGVIGFQSTVASHEAFIAEELLNLENCTASLSSGATRSLLLAGGPSAAGQTYVVLGSATGTAPGVAVDSVVLPLVADAYSTVTLTNANQPPFGNTLGVLDAAGQAVATLTVPPGTSPALAGLTLFHAYLALDPTFGFHATLASNAVPLELVP